MKKSSDHLLPLFKGETSNQLLTTMNNSHIKPCTDEEKENTELKIKKLLEERNQSK